MSACFWNLLRLKPGKYGKADLLRHVFFTNRSYFMKSNPGDCIHQRVIHAGGGLRGQKPKYSIFLSFGQKNIHSHNHRSFYLKRPSYTKRMPERLIQRLQKEDLLLK